MTEALLRVEQTSYAQAQILRLHQEFLGKIAVCKSPVVLSVHKGIGNGEQIGFCRAVRGKGCCGNTGNVNRAASAQHSVQHISLGAEHAAGLQINGDGSAGELLYLLLEGGCSLAYYGVQGINLSIYQGYGRVIRSVRVHLAGSLSALLSGSLALSGGFGVRSGLGLSGSLRGGCGGNLRLLQSASGQGAYHGSAKCGS